MRNSKNRLVVLATLVLAFVCSICLSVFSFAFATTEAKTINQVEIYMQRGATIRVATNAEQMGLRFTAVMDAGEYEGLLLNKGEDKAYASVKFGMVIIPVEYVEIVPLTKASLFGVDGEKKYQWTDKSNSTAGQEYIINLVTDELQTLPSFGDYVGFSGSITNIKDGVTSEVNNIDRDFVALSYIQVEDFDGKVEYKLASSIASYDEDNSELNLEEGTSVTRNAAQIAFAMVNDPNRADEKYAAENAAMQVNYIDKCVYDIVIMDGENKLSEETVTYGSSYTVEAPEKEGSYRIVNKFVGLTDEEGNEAPAVIEKVTGPATYTVKYEQQFIVADASAGAGMFSVGNDNNNYDAAMSSSATGTYNGQDHVLKILNGDASSHSYYFTINESYLKAFDEINFAVKGAVNKGWISWGGIITLDIGGNKIETAKCPTAWQLIKVEYNRTADTINGYLNGNLVFENKTFSGANKFYISTSGSGGGGGYSEWTLYVSDVIGTKKAENASKTLIVNNTALKGISYQDVIKNVEVNTEIKVDDLLFGTQTITTRTAGLSSPNLLETADSGYIVGYKFNGNTMAKGQTYTITDNTVVEPIVGSATVLNDFVGSTYNNNGTEDTTADDYLEKDGIKTFSTNKENTMAIVDYNIAKQSQALKYSYDSTAATGYIRLLPQSINTLKWNEYDVIVMEMKFTAGTTSGVKVGGTDLSVDSSKTNSFTVMVYRNPSNPNGSVKIGDKYHVYRKADIYYRTNVVNNTLAAANSGGIDMYGTYFFFQPISIKGVTVDYYVSNVYGFNLPAAA